jgi:TPR repeat protein
MRNLIKAAIAGVVVALGLAAPVAAGPLEDGLAAYSRGDYATAMQLWRPLADRGDADAQFDLGVLYQNGQGVPQDYAAALNWYRKAADQGNADAHQGGMTRPFGNSIILRSASRRPLAAPHRVFSPGDRCGSRLCENPI